ncbi:MAG: hypothetical protein IBX68_12335 [Dehalococcoidia bacterium]|nr:hypothetical protein [Dehalococcoidia bacterium]
MKAKTIQQLTELLKQVGTPDELAEIEKIVGEAKGKISFEPTQGFWETRTPCWEMCHCPEAIKSECPAPKYQGTPCWAIEGTYCKLDDYGARGDDTSICEVCRVYKRFGSAEPIKIQLFGRGIDTRVRAVEELGEKEKARS